MDLYRRSKCEINMGRCYDDAHWHAVRLETLAPEDSFEDIINDYARDSNIRTFEEAYLQVRTCSSYWVEEQDCPGEILERIRNVVVIKKAFEAYAKIFHERFTSYLDGSLNCSLSKNPLDSEVCRFGAKAQEDVNTGLHVMAGVMLAATGAFLFAPELAENIFPW